jgi:hypothetical protein
MCRALRRDSISQPSNTALNEVRVNTATGTAGAARHSVADRAKQLGMDQAIIESFKRFQGRPHYDLPQQTWFFAANSKLAGAVDRPTTAPTLWEAWDDRKLGWRRRTVLANLAGLNPDRPPRTPSSLEKLSEAFNHWPFGLVAVFQGGQVCDKSGHPAAENVRAPTNICNIYLGEALFADGIDQRDSNNKYYSARQIYDGTAPLLGRVANREAEKGDIVAWVDHVEVVTFVDSSAGTFCTIGCSGFDIGQELCADEQRRLNNSMVHFLRVRPPLH